jgi:hypothetical protein
MEVPEWGVTVELRGMTAGARVSMVDESYDANNGKTNLKTMYPRVITACVYDPKTGQPIFTAEDSDAILSKAAIVVERIALECLKLSAADEQAVTEAGKGLLGNPKGDSPLN